MDTNCRLYYIEMFACYRGSMRMGIPAHEISARRCMTAWVALVLAVSFPTHLRAGTGAAAKPALLVAIDNNDAATAAALLKTGTAPDIADQDGVDALNWAAYDGELPIVRLLVEHGAKIDYNANGPGLTSLMAAAATGHADVVQYLIAHGARIDLTDHTGWTALGYAVHNFHSDVESALRAAGANRIYDMSKGPASAADVVDTVWKAKAGDFGAIKGRQIKDQPDDRAWGSNVHDLTPKSLCSIHYYAGGTHEYVCQDLSMNKSDADALTKIWLDAVGPKVPASWTPSSATAKGSVFRSMTNPANAYEIVSVNEELDYLGKYDVEIRITSGNKN
jgi:hypothetical protein